MTRQSPTALPASEGGTLLHGLPLVLVWACWSILTLLCLGNFVASIPLYVSDVQTLCQPGSCVSGQPTVETARVLSETGLSVGVYAALSVGLVSLTALVYCGAAALIIWRRPRDWMALLVSSLFITQGLYENNYLQGPFDQHASPWHLGGLAVNYVSPVQVLFFCALFPNGRFVPRWMGQLLSVICVMDLLPTIFPQMPLVNPLQVAFVLSGFPLVALSMIYRYRSVSTLVEQQQTKWVVIGTLLVFVAFMAWFLPQIILYSSLSQAGSLYDLIGHPLFTLASLAIPFCVTIAVLRYRLWDIDVIINKALVYGSLTLLLTAVYAGLIVGLESLAEAIGGTATDHPVALVISTLAIAALFQPARRRIQNVIDRRFYRKKYNAEKTLAAFSAALRNEIDLNQLREQLIAVVDETMQSAHVSLWLRQPTSRVRSEQGNAQMTRLDASSQGQAPNASQRNPSPLSRRLPHSHDGNATA